MAKTWKVVQGLSSRLKLNDGNMIPGFGLGLYLMSSGGRGATKSGVQFALQQDYRLIDAAELYGNEEEVGEAIKESGINREDIYIVTKLWEQTGRDHCMEAFHASMKKLGLNYVDLYLMHSPLGGKLLETYDALLELKEKGLAKSVGVSNFNVSMLEGLRKSGRPTPAVNQIELHPYMRREKLVSYCRSHGIHLMAFSPLTKGKRLKEPEMVAMAEKYRKSVAQLFLRWSVQNGYTVIPKSATKERIIENCQVFDWSISDEDMQKLGQLPEATCLDPASLIIHCHEMEWSG